MAKKIKYQISERKFTWVEVETEKELVLVKELNKDMERFKKRRRKDKKRNVSLDQLYEEYEFEFASNESSILDVLIKEEEKRLIRQAVDSLAPRQKFVIVEYFWKNKSLRDIAKENNLHLSTVAEAYHSAMAKLGIMLKDLRD